MDFAGFVLAASTADLDAEPLARDHADAVEFRMDLADDPLSALRSYDGDLPVIATYRAAWEGGGAAGPSHGTPSGDATGASDDSSGGDGAPGSDGPADPADAARLDALVEAAACDGVAAVDVELAAVRDGDGERVVEAARERGVAVVVSAHDHGGTPPAGDLRATLAAAADAGDVGKLAVTATDVGDVPRLLSATRDVAGGGRRVATMAMGTAGRHSRAVAPLYGSRIGYAPVDPDAATAPGQFDLATLAGLLEAFGVGRV